MKVKNIGNKIVGFGNVFILPGEEADISDSFKENGAYNAYIDLGLVVEVEEKPTAKVAKKATANKGE